MRAQACLLFAALMLAESMRPALAGKSVAECIAFAQTSQQQLADSASCGFPPGWNGNWQQNYDYCRSAKPESTDKISQQRAVMMHMCKNVCPAYAAAAVHDVRVAGEAGCITPGPNPVLTDIDGTPGRWISDYNTHFRWCMSGVSARTLDRERTQRAALASRCAKCMKFVLDTDAQLELNQRTCKYDGPFWSRKDFFKRLSYCNKARENPDVMIARETRARQERLANCPSPARKAYCVDYANRALDQRQLVVDKKTTGYCGIGGQRWSANWSDHNRLCLEDPNAAGGEEGARKATLRECGIIDASSPPMVPESAAVECNVAVIVSLDECTNAADGTPVSNWDPGGMSPACGLGADEDEAKANALAAFLAAGIPVSEDPGWGQCSVSDQTIKGCTCDPGLATRSYKGAKKLPKDIKMKPFVGSGADKVRTPASTRVYKIRPKSDERMIAPKVEKPVRRPGTAGADRVKDVSRSRIMEPGLLESDGGFAFQGPSPTGGGGSRGAGGSGIDYGGCGGCGSAPQGPR